MMSLRENIHLNLWNIRNHDPSIKKHEQVHFMNINAKIAESVLNSLFRSLKPLKSKSVPLAAGKIRENTSLCLPLNFRRLQGPELQAGEDSREGQVGADHGRSL